MKESPIDGRAVPADSITNIRASSRGYFSNSVASSPVQKIIPHQPSPVETFQLLSYCLCRDITKCGKKIPYHYRSTMLHRNSLLTIVGSQIAL
ncbi:hypothetical protein TNCT_173461 [Trichonephila clavata]|uniref:Uncharacterized protein n=1 Tax=Trichonephila clavata TaxID=2740835 RepID=A0A8X6HN69_TRICU|nr:hypothetical protein TNCT_173461 [Trichonephila clavata]